MMKYAALFLASIAALSTPTVARADPHSFGFFVPVRADFTGASFYNRGPITKFWIECFVQDKNALILADGSSSAFSVKTKGRLTIIARPTAQWIDKPSLLPQTWTCGVEWPGKSKQLFGDGLNGVDTTRSRLYAVGSVR